MFTPSIFCRKLKKKESFEDSLPFIVIFVAVKFLQIFQKILCLKCVDFAQIFFNFLEWSGAPGE